MTAVSRFGIGANRPPALIDLVQNTMEDLNTFMTETPVIDTPEQAKLGGLYIERTRKAIADLEDERKAKVRPLNDQVSEINAEYRVIRDPLERLLTELRARLTAYAAAEEAKRQAEAEAKRQAAEEAERLAREAEAREREAIENAKAGELVDVGTAVVEADRAFADFGKADRAAARAERDTTVRITSGLGGRALSMRTKETLCIDDPVRALRCMGMSDKIRDAILSSARDYRKLKGKLPDGISAITERAI
jgi:hypothetical protein